MHSVAKKKEQKIHQGKNSRTDYGGGGALSLNLKFGLINFLQFFFIYFAQN